MKNKSIGKYLKYVLSFGISLGLLWYLFKDENLESLINQAKNANYSWILLSILIAMISHLIRAYRWKLFVKPLGYEISVFRSFLAVMIGYVTNLVLPRMGEFVKCGALKKLEQVPVSKSLGTIITERVIDLLMLAITLTLTFLLEYNKLKDYLFDVFGQKLQALDERFSFNYLILLCLAGGLGIAILLFVNRNRFKHHPFAIKMKTFLTDLWEGLTSIRKINNQLGFWLSSVMIWVLYYLMSYIVVFALPSTSNLSPIAGLTILAMGSIGMAAPVQGGIGTYHFMVTGVLVLYGIDQSQGILFTTLLHTSQTVGVIIVGVISLFISANLVKKVGDEVSTSSSK